MFKKEVEGDQTKGAENGMEKLKWVNYSMIISSKWKGENQEECGMCAKSFERGVIKKSITYSLSRKGTDQWWPEWLQML